MSEQDFHAVVCSAIPPDRLAGDGESWVQFFPAGTFQANDGRGPWKITDPHAVIEETLRRLGGRKMPIDYDHQMVFSTGPALGGTAVAAGWVTALEDSDGAIFARVKWNDRALKMIRAGEYRYISPYFASQKNTGEVLAIMNAALVNQPALDMEAVTASSKGTLQMSNLSASLRALLNLAETADDDTIVETVRGLRERADTASVRPDQYVPITLFQEVTAELNRNRQGVSLEAATVAVEAAVSSGKLMPAMRDWALDLCQANRPAFDNFINNTASSVFQTLAKPHTPPGLPPGRKAAVSDEDAAIARNLGLEPADMTRGGQDQ